MKKKVELNLDEQQFLDHLRRSGYPTYIVEAFQEAFEEPEKKKVKK